MFEIKVLLKLFDTILKLVCSDQKEESALVKKAFIWLWYDK